MHELHTAHSFQLNWLKKNERADERMADSIQPANLQQQQPPLWILCAWWWWWCSGGLV